MQAKKVARKVAQKVVKKDRAGVALAPRVGGPAGVNVGVTFDSVRAAARAFPGIEESTSYGTPALKVKGKLIVRLHQSGECFVLRVDLKQRDALIRSQPAVYYFTEHYRNYPWVLVRFLTVDPDELPAMVERAWRLEAPAALVTKYGRG